MERKLILTGDGSHSIAVPEMQVTYHSIHGAIQESRHVFVEAGFVDAATRFPGQELLVFEMGFGTGLNAFMTLLKARETSREVHYTTVDAFPLDTGSLATLNYPDVLAHREAFELLHHADWEVPCRINDHFTLLKRKTKLEDFLTAEKYHLVYYDAFAPAAQPALWTEQIFRKIFAWMIHGGVFVTYCSKGDVRRALQAAGFRVEKIPGPPGKREMLRARKAVFQIQASAKNR